jgi:DNA-binding beta-propeller fold protein YncE
MVKNLLFAGVLFVANLFAGYSIKTIDLLPRAGVTFNGAGPLLVRSDTLRNRIILANTLTSSLSVIDSRTHLVQNIPLAGRVPQHLKAEAMTIDEKKGDVYLIGTRCFFIVFVQQARSECIPTNKQFESIAVDENSGNVFLAGRESATLAFYHAKNKKLSYLPWLHKEEPMANLNATPPPPIRKVMADPRLKKIIAVDGNTSFLYLFDAQSGKQLSRRSLDLSKDGRWHLAGYNAFSHCLYLAIETTDRRVVQVARIGIESGRDDIVKLPELREGVGIIYNPNREEVYVPYDNAACVHVVDFKNPVQEVALPSFGNDATALDLHRQLLYVASWPQGDVEVVDLQTRKFFKRISHKGILPHMFNMAFSPHENLLYLPKGGTAVNGAFGAAVTTLDPDAESVDKIYTGWLPMDLIEWEKGKSFLVFNNEDQMVQIDDQQVLSSHRLPVEYPIQSAYTSEKDVYLSYGAHQSYWPNVYIWDARNGILTINKDFSYYDRRIPRQAQKIVLDKNGVLHFTQNPWGTEEQFLGNLPDPVRLFEIGTRILLGDQVDRETTQRMLQYDASLHRLYLARVAEKDSTVGVLQIIDPMQKKVLGRVSVGRCPADLAFDESNIYVANFQSNSVSIVDKNSFAVQNFSSGPQPLKLAVMNRAAWVILHQYNMLQEIKIGSEPMRIPAAGKPDNIFIWGDRLIITVHDSQTFTVLAFVPQTRTFESIIQLNYPYGDTSFDTGNASFYMSGQYGDVVYALNQAKVDSRGRLWLTDFLSGKVFVLGRQ